MALRKRYACKPQGAIQVREDGQVWFHGRAQVLIGLVLDGGKRIALSEGTLSYLASPVENVTRDPMSYLQGCEEPSGRSMFDSFDVSSVPDVGVSANVDADKRSPGQLPAETSSANERAASKNAAE